MLRSLRPANPIYRIIPMWRLMNTWRRHMLLLSNNGLTTNVWSKQRSLIPSLTHWHEWIATTTYCFVCRRLAYNLCMRYVTFNYSSPQLKNLSTPQTTFPCCHEYEVKTRKKSFSTPFFNLSQQSVKLEKNL